MRYLPIFAALALLTSCGSTEGPRATTGSSASPSPVGVAVAISAFEFRPHVLRTTLGAEVRWDNEDDILHTVTSGRPPEQGVPGVSENRPARPDGLFDMKVDGVDASATFVFEEAGRHPYYCAIHPGMSGVVVVDG